VGELRSPVPVAGGAGPSQGPGSVEQAEDEEATLRRRRLWAYLEALDRSTERRSVPPTNALLLAVLMLPPLREALDPDSTGVRDVGHLVARSIAPALERLRPSRRDSELARQILLAIRYILPSKNPRRKRPRLAGREFFDEALRLSEIVSDAESVDATLAGRPIAGEGAAVEVEIDEEAAPPELEPLEPIDGGRRRRRGRRGDDRGGRGIPVRGGAIVHAASRPPAAMDLNALSMAARSLVTPDGRPAFLGTGAFGGPWSSRAE
jgi:hypothetical protein